MEYLLIKNVQSYIEKLNTQNYGGYKDWRLPTLEEAMSLMEPRGKSNLYFDPKFDSAQEWIWTSDKISASGAWVVSFSGGYCGRIHVSSDGYVRAVR